MENALLWGKVVPNTSKELVKYSPLQKIKNFINSLDLKNYHSLADTSFLGKLFERVKTVQVQALLKEMDYSSISSTLGSVLGYGVE